MMNKIELIQAIEKFCADTGMAETTFGRKAVNDGKFVGRLKGGGRIWPETADRVATFIKASDTEAVQ